MSRTVPWEKIYMPKLLILGNYGLRFQKKYLGGKIVLKWCLPHM